MPGRRRTDSRRGNGLLLLGLSLGYFMVMLDTTVVTVALPAIGADLSGSLGALQWVSNGYTLTFAALLLTAGALADRHGGRRVFLAGLWLFGACSGVSALAGSMGALIALRALLGVAGALLLPASLAVIAHAWTEPAARARAMGVWAAISGSALAAGPLVGGALTDRFGWQAIFLVNVPVAFLALALTARHAPADRPGADRGRADRGVDRGVDLPGQVCAVPALTGLTCALIEGGPAGWGSLPVLGGFAVFALSGGLFVLVERRRETAGRAVMLPLGLLRDRTLATGLGAGLLVNFGLSGVLFVLSLHFQRAHGLSAFGAGVAFLPLMLPTAFNPVFTGRLVGRIGARRPAVAGFLLMGVGVLVAAAATGGSTVARVATAGGLLVLGFGVSFAIPSLMTAVVGAVAKEQSGIASGALNSARQTGAVLGVAVLGATADAAGDGSGTRLALLVAGVALLAGAAAVGAFLARPVGPRGPNPARPTA
ncbi:MFS transporter [Kitasatospora sp. CB01950]|uniref:MFS transporter n=1 Tax=Kitasatospora sp. CB01950 TaxID=1703930 RepID=UPI000AEFB811|nr:MFS transporter [Kitasatospora sp. CB01950]